MKLLANTKRWIKYGWKANHLHGDKKDIRGDNQFIIFDAKYYNAYLEFGNTPKAQPGIEAVTKQYLYQLAYQNFIKEHDFLEVKNCFLMPTENKEIEDHGESEECLNDLESWNKFLKQSIDCCNDCNL